MNLNEIKEFGGKKKRRKRVGRGTGSGSGKTCGRGTKGQKSRSGSFGSPFFEGGQTPLFRRLPKRGFTSHFKNPSVVNLTELNRFEDGSTVDIEVLKDAGLVRRSETRVKILGGGTLEKKLTVAASDFSGSAVETIAKSGGKAERV